MTSKPSVLFVCVHNAGRSPMAAGWLRHLAVDQVEVRSAGSQPKNEINPVAVQAMAEVGIDITGNKPRILDYATAESSDVLVTMGCGDVCPAFPGKRYLDWQFRTRRSRASKPSAPSATRSGRASRSSSPNSSSTLPEPADPRSAFARPGATETPRVLGEVSKRAKPSCTSPPVRHRAEAGQVRFVLLRGGAGTVSSSLRTTGKLGKKV